MPIGKLLSAFGIGSGSDGSEERGFTTEAGAVADPNAETSVSNLWFNTLLGGALSSAGVSVSRETSIQVSTVFACLDFLANQVGSVPLHIYRRKANGGSELALDHPLYAMLNSSPNPEMSSMDFRKALQSNLSLHGNGYALISRNGFGDIQELQPVEAWEVEVRRVGRAVRYVIGGKEYDSHQVIHLRGMTFNGLLGADVTQDCRDAIGLAVALDRNAGYFFKNGSFPGGFLEHPKRLTEEAALRLQQSFQEQTGGANSGRTKILEEGMQWKAGRTANRESQFDESRDRQSKDIARIFRVPQHKVGIIGNQPRANVEEENKSFVVDTLQPILTTWEQAFTQKLLSRQERAEYYIGFNIGALLKGDFKSQNEAFALGRQWGWWSVNDVRRMLNQEPIEGGDTYLQPMNMEAAGKAKEGSD